MIAQALVEGLRSVISQSLTSAPEAKRMTPLSIFFIGGVCGVSLILAEVFVGLSFYKMLHVTYNRDEGFSLMMAALMYICQAAISVILIKHHFTKKTQENIISKEYKLVKGVLHALIEGYKSK